MKAVINTDIGVFGISFDALCRLCGAGQPQALETLKWFLEDWNKDRERADRRWILKEYFGYHIPRDDPDLLSVVEDMGRDAGKHLKIVEFPDDIEWDIGENEMGMEWVYEKHRTWS